MNEEKTYEDGYNDGFMKGTEQARKTIEELAEGICNPIIYEIPESVAVKLLQEQIKKMRCCENCDYYSYWGDKLKCNYSIIKEIKENKIDECHNFDKWIIKKELK